MSTATLAGPSTRSSSGSALARMAVVPPVFASGGVRDHVDATLAHAAREVCVSVASGRVNGRLARPRRVHLANLARGVRYRVLLPERTLASVEGRRLVEAWTCGGVELRAAPEVPLAALVIDGTAAVLPGAGGDVAGEAALFTLPSVVGAAVALFERVWESAAPPGGADAGADDLAPREREVLVLLASGRTDESVATMLGISVRTVRRLVAGLLERLGARSRFEAGAKAARRGWLGS
ncbi:helix-turn-helix transcriptional regulator [Saccharomonospora glauca]|uniref:Response regulator containing a CheY-like receiver domain and an HTH DNA-binding domain n=1 Tax=Saccharomonospora glauca K62 TaxID=928724 RepID=I1D3N2_9PSEU|nr:helix-turn-helix transcriptional regulator [Saccharomonospora glauca]EIE99556.1 response regulator containing a CheY-like receiver domain and an HTH DNA-binding domain [Saccharomonospora glauca K62]